MFIIVESFKTSPLYNTLIYVILTDMPHRFWTLCMHLNVSAILQQQRIDWKYASTHVVVLKYWPVCRSIKHTFNGSNIILCIIHIEWANAIRINVNSINLLQSLTYLKGFKYFFFRSIQDKGHALLKTFLEWNVVSLPSSHLDLRHSP